MAVLKQNWINDLGENKPVTYTYNYTRPRYSEVWINFIKKMTVSYVLKEIEPYKTVQYFYDPPDYYSVQGRKFDLGHTVGYFRVKY